MPLSALRGRFGGDDRCTQDAMDCPKDDYCGQPMISLGEFPVDPCWPICRTFGPWIERIFNTEGKVRVEVIERCCGWSDVVGS